MTLDEAIRYMRERPEYAEVVEGSFLGRDVENSARRFERSGEFREVVRLLAPWLKGGTVVDLGAGSGIASWAFLQNGAGTVYAVEPDPSEEVGQGAIRRLDPEGVIRIVSSYGESIDLPDACADVFYGRQVLHHTQNLNAVIAEAFRILKPGGVALICREHVVRDEADLQEFLDNHAVHKLVGGENAFKLEEYTGAFQKAGFTRIQALAPLDSLITAHDVASSYDELRDLPRRKLKERFGPAGAVAAAIPGVTGFIWKRLRRPRPGEQYSFMAIKPK